MQRRMSVWSSKEAVVAETVKAWLSLGSNIEPQANIDEALDGLRAEFGALVVSPVYRSRAVGCEGNDFLNLVVGVKTSLPVKLLRSRLRALEAKQGRQRQADKNAPRTLDIDLLTYGDLVVETDEFSLPNDDITRYAFVLLPLSEVAGDQIHPLTGLSYGELWSRFNDPSQRLWRV